MTAKRITRKLLKIIAFIIGGFLVLLIAFHFWFVNYSESIVEDLVSSQSNGQLKLKVHKFRFNWFSYKMQLFKPVFYSNDTSASTAYQFGVEKINLRLKAILPLLFEKKMLIDSLHLYNPDIIVTRLRSSAKDSSDTTDTELSLPKEMGRIYNSIQDALKVLDVDRFQIDNGKFSLVNKIDPAESPVTITNINFLLDNLQVDSTRPEIKKKILFSDNVSLHTYNQNILFPDGRHRLAFSNFKINILKQLVEFDSCTVMATKGDSTDNSFSIFFDKLQMTNIDFNALYHHEVIKADSVYCINPRFRLDVEAEKKTGSAKSPPKLNELIQQLTGDMQLAFVVVENASFDINIARDKQTSSFTSDHNNFELQGLSIEKNAPRPLTVGKFVMAIRNYENFLHDSSYAIQFDSILINNNRISLSNFSYKELEKNQTVNHLAMPQFELQGLSWDDLVFDQHLKAEKVTLYRPVIHYSVGKNKQVQSGDVFEALAGIGSFMQLDNLHIHDGQVNLLFRNNAQLKLENASMSIQGKQLVNSKRLTNIQRSVDKLFFKKGYLKMGDISADLTDVNYNGGTGDQLFANNLQLKSKAGFDIDADAVKLGSIFFDDKIRHAVITGINWNKAAIILSSFPSFAGKQTTELGLKQIRGANTTIIAADNGKKITMFLENLSADEFSTNTASKNGITGLAAAGNNLVIESDEDQLRIKDFDLADHKLSSFKQFHFTRKYKSDSIDIKIPKLEFVADINALLNGKISTGDIRLTKPIIHLTFQKNNNSETENKNNNNWPETKIGRLIIEEPVVQFSHTSEKGISHLTWNGVNNIADVSGFEISHSSPSKVSAEKLNLSLHHFLYTNAKGKTFDAKEGQLEIQLNNIELKQNEINGWDWKTFIVKMNANNFVLDSLGKNAGKLTIEKAKLNDFSVVSTSLLNLRELISNNTKFRLEELTGSYHNDKHLFNWYNSAYDKSTRFFSADSFSYRPTTELKNFIAASPYQTDYITAKTGAIAVGPFEIEKYLRDTVLDLGTMQINNGMMTVFRDMRKNREPGVVKLLPVNLLKKIPVHLQVDTLNINNAKVEYEEHNEKTNQAGKVTVADLNGQVINLRNHDLKKNDSLHTVATAFIQNKIPTWLYVKESYTDSLGGFVMTVQMGHADLTVLNPVLHPLVSAEVKSGKLDTLTMRVIGREAHSYGEIKMLYHDLKVAVLKNGENKRSLLGGIKSFFANTFIKNKNTEKTATVFFKRLRDRSAMNYLVKITFNGIINTVIGKKNKKSYRMHKEEIKEKSLPTIKSSSHQ